VHLNPQGKKMTISKLSMAAAAAVTLIATPFAAQAADMPVRGGYYKAPPRSVVSYYNWTGFYAGIVAGYGFGSSDWSAVPTASNKPKGAMAGGTLGYNWQTGAFVLGLEGDFSWSGVKGSSNCGPGLAFTCETANGWLATVRGRAGYAIDRWLPYITAGGAYGDVKATTSIAGLSASSSKSKLGWTAGVGVEYAFLGNWSAKLEYLYVDLGSFDTGPAPVVNNVSFKENIIRAGLNYKFSGPVFSRF
jgi:outer membrane immunogenic protein